MKALFSNLGYAKGISGSLYHHLALAKHHLYTPRNVQQQTLRQFRDIIDVHQPDVCCMVEVDRGSLQSGYFNQIKALMCEDYCEYDIVDKYGEKRLISHLPFHGGKSNAFLAKKPMPYKRHYFVHGTKRLLHEISLTPTLTLFFTHFSLQHHVRIKQFEQLRTLIKATEHEVVVLGDFNIFRGVDELAPLLETTGLVLLNDFEQPTFRFHQRALTLDIGLCSASLAPNARLDVIPQAFSDHAALLLNIDR